MGCVALLLLVWRPAEIWTFPATPTHRVMGAGGADDDVVDSPGRMIRALTGAVGVRAMVEAYVFPAIIPVVR